MDGTSSESDSASRPWPELLAPAIDYAETGFPVSEIIAADWQSAEPSLKVIPTSAACYLPGGPCARKGDDFSQSGPREVARSDRPGTDATRFTGGLLAEAIVSYSTAVGGLFSLSDFTEHTSNFIEPVSTNYRGYDVWELPPNGQGIAVLQMLNLLEPYNLKSMGPQSADALHLMIEAKKLAYEDRAKYLRRPRFCPATDRIPDIQAVRGPSAC